MERILKRMLAIRWALVPGSAGQGWAGPGPGEAGLRLEKIGKGRAGQSRTGHGLAWPGSIGQGRAGLGRAGQGKNLWGRA